MYGNPKIVDPGQKLLDIPVGDLVGTMIGTLAVLLSRFDGFDGLGELGRLGRRDGSTTFPTLGQSSVLMKFTYVL